MIGRDSIRRVRRIRIGIALVLLWTTFHTPALAGETVTAEDAAALEASPAVLANAAATEESLLPPGFDAIAVDRSDAGTIEIAVSGRRYLFAAGPLPSSISSLERAVLAAPPAFALVVSGRPTTVVWDSISVLDESPRMVRFRTRGRGGSLRLNAETTVEFDGMIRVSLHFSSDRSLEITTFTYRLPVALDVARFYNRHLSYDYTTMRVKRDVLLDTAGPVPESRLEMPYVPSVAVGDLDVGIEWWSDTSANWTGASRSQEHKPIRLERRADRVDLEITPIASPIRLDPGETWSHEFAVFAFPMRKAPSVVHSNRFISPGEARTHREVPWARLFTIVFPGQFDARWHGLPGAADSPAQRKLRERFERLGTGYVPYAKLMAAPSMHPRTMQMLHTWSSAGKPFTGPADGERKFIRAHGWKTGTPYSYAVCGTERAYFDWILDETLHTIAEESPAAIYYDWGSIMEPCRNRRRNGRLEWGYFELRDFYRRLYEAVKSRHPDILITIHTHGQPRAIGAFIDYVFVGEALNVAFRGPRSLREIRRNPRLYEPHYMNLPDGFLEAQVFPRTGGTTALLPEIHLGRDESDPRREVRMTREMFAETLVSNIAVWLTNSDVATRSAIMSAVDRFGDLDRSRFHSWRTDPLGVSGIPGIRASAYEGTASAMVVVSNRNGTPTNVELRASPELLRRGSAARVTDLERPESEVANVEDGMVSVRVPARDFRLLRFEAVELEPVQ